MFNLAPNPEYVPGGLNNFWTTRPAGQDGQATSAGGTLATGTAAAGPPRSFMAGFFKNPAAAADKSSEPSATQRGGRVSAATPDGQMFNNLAATACRHFLPSLNNAGGF